jgi:hypothetical protein
VSASLMLGSGGCTVSKLQSNMTWNCGETTFVFSDVGDQHIPFELCVWSIWEGLYLLALFCQGHIPDIIRGACNIHGVSYVIFFYLCFCSNIGIWVFCIVILGVLP